MIYTATDNIEQEFNDWLRGANGIGIFEFESQSFYNAGVFEFENCGFYNAVVQISKNSDFSYLYHQTRFGEHGITAGDDFKYAGVLYKKDSKVYDMQWELIKSLPYYDPDQNGGTANMLTLDLREAVRKEVEAFVNSDQSMQAIKDKFDRMPERSKSGSGDVDEQEARRMYLSDIDPRETKYKCNYVPETLSGDKLLEYILSPEQYAKKEANACIRRIQDDILMWYSNRNSIIIAYKRLIADRTDSAHCVKKIMTAIRRTLAKQVTVTICKDGITMTFKTKAGAFRRDCQYGYDLRNIALPDRQKFEKTFGKHSTYIPDEITKIMYNRTVLYEV
jgi:hypothetical protein